MRKQAWFSRPLLFYFLTVICLPGVSLGEHDSDKSPPHSDPSGSSTGWMDSICGRLRVHRPDVLVSQMGAAHSTVQSFCVGNSTTCNQPGAQWYTSGFDARLNAGLVRIPEENGITDITFKGTNAENAPCRYSVQLQHLGGGQLTAKIAPESKRPCEIIPDGEVRKLSGLYGGPFEMSAQKGRLSIALTINLAFPEGEATKKQLFEKLNSAMKEYVIPLYARSKIDLHVNFVDTDTNYCSVYDRYQTTCVQLHGKLNVGAANNRDWALNGLFNGMDFTPKITGNMIGHELGHLLSLKDHYDRGTPHKAIAGRENDIMAWIYDPSLDYEIYPDSFHTLQANLCK